ncbi:hypothetical protein XBO1_1300079 [Xenorhabdus bovienii str. oregonense]|uniref:Uncharacterized protein n=1 Tax=Xenorhabdus bovienii str. oregonense TaxID=1398202 RepID=A0A077P0G1_XENBV|nr:hypothetical protein [Xenorhabdus bovienii]CDH04505.1 hypothetical protein XBO1_1300079 [Xenorhabdus bovienii str. oregonense]
MSSLGEINLVDSWAGDGYHELTEDTKNLIDWLNLRKPLWPESSETKHLKEISEIIESQHKDITLI